MNRILFTRTHPNAVAPTRGSLDAAGWDLYAASFERTPTCLIVDTGLQIEFDPGYVLQIHARSGLAMKHGIHLINGTGIIDADYRGPLKIMLTSTYFSLDSMESVINIGDRIAQAILLSLPHCRWEEIETLSKTQRGAGGFGSSGK